MRKIGSMSSRLMRATNLSDANPEVSIFSKTSADKELLQTTTDPSPPSSGGFLLPLRVSSWRAKTPKTASKKHMVKSDLVSFCSQLKNVRESKVAQFFEEEYLCSIQFDNRALSLDELQIAAMVMLERTAPAMAFSDKAGLTILFDFLSQIRSMYRANPYHDFRHAVDVMQFTHFLLSQEDVWNMIKETAEPETKFLLLVACVCHDAGHDGLTNAIHRKTPDDALVKEFGEESPLEKLHASYCERFVPRILDHLALEVDSDEFLSKCRSLILGTDMEKHASLLKAFTLNPSGNLLSMLIKIADISNVTRDWEEAEAWSKRLDAEMKLHPGFVPTMSMADSVTWFSNTFAKPLVEALTDSGLQITGRSLQLRIEANLLIWAQKQADSANPGL